MSRQAVIAGWFSFDGAHATIGDELARDSLCEGLAEASIPFRLLLPGGGTEPNDVKVWVSGPVDRSYPVQAELLGDGTGWIITSSTLILDRLGPGNADVSTARDGAGVSTTADLAYLAPSHSGGFAAVLLRGAQPEYRQHPSQHQAIAETVNRALVSAGLLPVPLTTRIAADAGALARFAGGLEAAIAASAVVITSRLHGIMHSLRAGRIPIVIDEIEAGGKVGAFCRAFGAPIFVPAAECTVDRLAAAIDDAAGYSASDAADLWNRARHSARHNRADVVALIGGRLEAS